MALLGTASFEGLAEREALWQQYQQIRDVTLRLTAPLSIEDQQVQSMPDASPTKWHLGHTSWFFDTVILLPQHRAVGSAALQYCFNSYYESVGKRQPRPQRGLLTRPSLAEVLHYRKQVDHAIRALIFEVAEARWPALADQITLGLHHEQQHQELLLMDIKHLFFSQPLRPSYTPDSRAEEPDLTLGDEHGSHLNAVPSPPPGQTLSQSPAKGYDGEITPIHWLPFSGGLVEIGACAGSSFFYDNEGPRHRVWLQAYELADRLVSCGEWLEFINDGGYERPELWLSDGWAAVQAQEWSAPLYWLEGDSGHWQLYTLQGERAIALDEPVVHVSFYEAEAFARWAQARLPTEAEWEHAASSLSCTPPSHALHPRSAPVTAGLRQLMGSVWQWTASAYLPYPGFQPAPGIAAEYNGKFMSGQMVLRGSACITPIGHSRLTYRNFFMPQARWAFSGVRLARDRHPSHASEPRQLHPA